MSRVTVRYKGVSDVRIITKKEFASVGVTVDKDVEWNAGNRWSVVMDADDRTEEVLREQGHFTLSATDDTGGEAVISNATNTAGEGDVLVDGSTGASTPAKRSKS